MMRSKHLLASAIGLGFLAFSCLWMLRARCPGCGFQWLSEIAAGAIVAATGVGATIFALALWRTQHLWRLCRMAAAPHPPKLQAACQRLGLRSDQVLCAGQPDALSFCIGLIRPQIVVTTGLLEHVSAQELTAILAHECHHQVRRDPLRVLAMTVVRAILYPLPVAHDFYDAFLTLVEIEADEAATARSGQPALAAALYKLLALSPSNAPASLPAGVTPFSVCSSRIAYLLDPQQAPILPLSTARLALSLLPILLLCLSMFAA